MNYIWYDEISPYKDLEFETKPNLISGDIEYYMTHPVENQKINEFYKCWRGRRIEDSST